MRPAISVLLLTTLIGVGQGLLLALYTAEICTILGLVAPQDERFYVAGSGLVLGFLVAGLGASFFHLGRPERAWRSAAQWRTSWLSREVIVLPVLIVAATAYGLSHLPGLRFEVFVLPGGAVVMFSAVVGLIASAACLALFVCTGMIYACLPFLREWRTPLTVVNLLLMGTASGFAFASAFALQRESSLAGFFAGWALVLTVFAFAGRGASLLRNARLRPLSTMQTAIGIKHTRIVQITMGFMGGSFNTREFFHGVSLAAMRSVKWVFLIGAFVAPVALLAAGLVGARQTLFVAAFVVQYLGLLAERWLFFAEANHPQNLYYQAVG